jgi:hypothetical protein
MSWKATSRMPLALLLAIALGLWSCESSKGHAALLQYAFSWEQIIKALGFPYMSDLSAMEKQSREMGEQRERLRAHASDGAQEAARQLDSLILYVAKCLDQNIKENAARPESDLAAGFLQVKFPDASLNTLLGLDPKEGDASAERSIEALHTAIRRFADKVGVASDFQDAVRRREESDRAGADRTKSEIAPTFAKVRAEKLRVIRAKKALLEGNREKAEKQALDVKGPAGFGAAKWLMYPDEVRKACPNATPDAEGNLVEKTVWIDRPVKVTYKFENGFLIRVMIAFEGPSDESSFAATQKFLEGTYKMPKPRESEPFLLASDYQTGSLGDHVIQFSILHVLGTGASHLEQVIYAREDYLRE